MDFRLQRHGKRMRESDMGANCNLTVSKGGPSMSRPVVQEGDSFKPKQVTMEKSISELPHDILASILFKLPAIYLSSLRCVCKSWDSLIRKSSFVKQHFYNRAKDEDLGIISLSVDYRSYKRREGSYYSRGRSYYYYSPEYFSLKFFEEDSHLSNRHEFDLSKILKGSYYTISNSCDGLICIYSLVNTYIINPSIRRLRQLPRGSLHFENLILPGSIIDSVPMVGIGFDSSSGAYKVVRIFRPKYEWRISLDKEDMNMQGEVYTLGGSCSWKAIGKVPLTASISRLTTLPVTVNGAVHWVYNGNFSRNGPRKEAVLSFNIREETFGVILHPRGPSGSYLSLMELKGCLCLCDHHGSAKQIDIWMLEDYNKHKWIKQYSINLKMMHKWSVHLGCRTKPLTIRGGKMVLCNKEGRMDYFNLEEEKFDKHEELVVDLQSNAPYIGSLIWPKERVAKPYI